MPDLATLLPPRGPDLVVRPFGNDGQFVVKNPQTGDFYYLSEMEHFVLMHLDGRQTSEEVRAAFERRFDEPLPEEELSEFLGLLRSQRLLVPDAEDTAPLPSAVQRQELRSPEAGAAATRRQSILFWRKNLFDPDRLFTWLAPRIAFLWSRVFLVLSAGCILTAFVLVGANWQELTHSLSGAALRGETAVLVWLTLFVVTMLHESAHGLTCKHYGGEVHEIGFLMLFFMPCFYCNVSDAWLFKEKSRRLWVTFAGGYFELFLWALAVFVWQLTLPGSLPHYLAFVVLSVCGIQTLFNFNPLLKLDGYYLFSDWVEVPNLQQRALDYFMGQLRRLLWGARRPVQEPRGRLLLGYGLTSWLYSVIFLVVMLWAIFQFLGFDWGWPGVMGVVLLGFISARGLLHGVAAGEVHTMITTRHKRTILWLLVLGSLVAGLCLIEMEDRSSGPFRLRPASRAELRAPVAGFLQAVYCDEGDRVSPGALVARLVVPGLESRLAQKQAELREVQTKLRLLEIGPRPEEIAEQRQRVQRAQTWRDLARQDLSRGRQAFAEDLNRLEKQIEARRAELEAAHESYQRAKPLVSRRAIAEEQYQELAGRHRVCEARLAEAQAAKRSHEARGTLEAEAELARRDKELADAAAVLRLLEAGSRPEEVEGERARLERLRAEVRHLEHEQGQQVVTAPVSGLVSTPRLKEKVGQYLREGDLIGVVEEAACLEAEIALAEQDVVRVQAGQEVQLKTRALPFDSLATRVERLAPAAGRGEEQSRVTVYCRLDHAPAELRPEMTGYARVYTGKRPVGAILLERTLRLLRTEYWW